MTINNTSLILNLRSLYTQKTPPKSLRVIISIIKTQLSLIYSLNSDAHKKFSFIVSEVAKNFSKENLDLMDRMGKFNKTQQKILIDSLELELQQIFSVLDNLKTKISEQKIFVENSYNHPLFLQGYTKLLIEENNIIIELEKLFKADIDLERKFLDNVSAVEKVKSENWFIKKIKKYF